MKYKLVIFDLDGTILDTLDDLALAMNAARRMSGLAEQPHEKVMAMVGNGVKMLIKRSTVDEPDADREKLFDDFTSFYIDNCTTNTFPYKGIEDLLKKLRSEGIKIAVDTNKQERPSKILCETRLPGLIDKVVGQSEKYPLKPAPDAVFDLMREFGVKPEETLFVGDSEVDIQTGINAGVDVVSVDWGFKSRVFLEEHNAKMIISDPMEILGL